MASQSAMPTQSVIPTYNLLLVSYVYLVMPTQSAMPIYGTTQRQLALACHFFMLLDRAMSQADGEQTVLDLIHYKQRVLDLNILAARTSLSRTYSASSLAWTQTELYNSTRR